MKPQDTRLTLIIIGAICAGAILGALGYYFISGSHSGQQAVLSEAGISDITPVSTTSSLIISNGTSSVPASTSSLADSLSGPGDGSSDTQPVYSTPPAVVNSPGTADTSTWKTYTSYELGFSFQYPSSLIPDTSNSSAVTLTFPANYYSTTPSSVDTFSVTVSATCPTEQSYSDLAGAVPSQSVNIGGNVFTENSQEGAAAGSYYRTTFYQTNNNSVCYTIEYNSHGADSVGPPANIQSIVNSMLSTFAFISTPAGENEAAYSAQQTAAGQASAPTGLINLASVSTSTVSVGGNLILTGSGFSGHDTIVWISNGSVQGVLWGGMSSSDTSITAAIPAQACTQYTGASGAPCPSYIILNPGIYTVSVANQNGNTNPLYIHIQ